MSKLIEITIITALTFFLISIGLGYFKSLSWEINWEGVFANVAMVLIVSWFAKKTRE
jgi:hypothetical protein